MHEINKMLQDLLVGIALGWEQTCGVKIAHHSEALAQKHADDLNNGTRRERRPYACVWCLHWHVGARISKSHMTYLCQEVIAGRRIQGRGNET